MSSFDGIVILEFSAKVKYSYTTMKLLDEAYTLLDASNESIRTISDKSGLNYHWLSKFNQRIWPNPGVNHVQKLRDYLKNEGIKARE